MILLVLYALLSKFILLLSTQCHKLSAYCLTLQTTEGCFMDNSIMNWSLYREASSLDDMMISLLDLLSKQTQSNAKQYKIHQEMLSTFGYKMCCPLPRRRLSFNVLRATSKMLLMGTFHLRLSSFIKNGSELIVSCFSMLSPLLINWPFEMSLQVLNKYWQLLAWDAFMIWELAPKRASPQSSRLI